MVSSLINHFINILTVFQAPNYAICNNFAKIAIFSNKDFWKMQYWNEQDIKLTNTQKQKKWKSRV